jgi:5-methylcytosine-specific restriction endonuclease McrA
MNRHFGGKRRIVKLKAFVEDVQLGTLWIRDGGTCQLCGDPINPALKAPDPKSVSIDHVIPLSRGGEHSYANTQLAHFGCNSRKGSRVA